MQYVDISNQFIYIPLQHLIIYAQLRYKNDKSLPVSVALRPDDPFALRIRSSTASVDSVLLKVTLPRWTGRKRKRGTSGPFTVSGKDVDSSNESVSLPPPSAQQLTRMLRDNVGKYQVQPIAHIKKAIRFRDLPDFQFVASDVPLMREVASKLIAPTSMVCLGRSMNSTDWP